MQTVEENHPVLQSLRTVVKAFNPDLFFQKEFGLILPKTVIIRGLVGVEDRTTIRTADGETLYQGKRILPLLNLQLDTGRAHPLDMTPNLGGAHYQEQIQKLIRHLAEKTRNIIEGRPI